jgi:hypothetical protein
MKGKIVSTNDTLGVFLVGRHGCKLQTHSQKVLVGISLADSKKSGSIF